LLDSLLQETPLHAAMVEVLGPSQSTHRELFPPEIDVYRVPHTRMKELVVSVGEILPQIEESLCSHHNAVEALLQLVYSIMWEMKTHEIIENTVIMNQLRERMNSRQVYNKFVCNCHEDSELLSIIDLVESIYFSLDQTSRTFYWQRLQEEIYQFLEDFDQHMEEEESIFQPLLNQYFNYEELVQIKDTVLDQHREWKERVDVEKSLKNSKRSKIDEITNSGHVKEDIFRGASLADTLPREVIVEILGYLDDPRDLARAAQVSCTWDQCSRDPVLWRNLPLSNWEKDMWTFSSVDLSLLLLSPASISPRYEPPAAQSHMYQGVISSLLPRVGPSVRSLSLTDSRDICMAQINHILKLVPDVTSLDLSYTSVSSPALSCISLARLTKLNLSGCLFVTDDFVQKLVTALGPGSETLQWLSVSGCEDLTDRSLCLLSQVCSSLSYFDCSGCFKLSGEKLRKFTSGCRRLGPEYISYCNVIQDGPFPALANGCDNTDCDNIRSCCLNSRIWD